MKPLSISDVQRLLDYYKATRGCGHTTAARKAGVPVVAADVTYARAIGGLGIRELSRDSNQPIVLDNSLAVRLCETVLWYADLVKEKSA